MRTSGLFLLAAGLLLCGCGAKSDNSAAATNSSSGSRDYLGGLGNARNKAINTVDTTSLTKAIQLFNVDHARNPKDLDELVKEKYLPQIPPVPYGMKLVYDSDSGNVSVQKQ
jgi:hypothetical protein